MDVFLNRIFNLRAGETTLVITLGIVILGNSLAQKVSEIASISNFLSDVGPPQFLLVLIISSFISILMTGVQSLLVDRFDRVKLVRSISFCLALSFVVLRVLFLVNAPQWLNYGLFYLLSDQQLVFFPMAFWVLANDLFDFSQSKRLFPLLASWGFVGNLLGIGVTALSPVLFAQLAVKPEEILMVNILIYLLIHVLIESKLGHDKVRKMPQKRETIQETLSEGWNFVREIPAFRYLMLAIVAVIICETVIEYRFFVVSESAFSDTNQLQMFLSLFTLARVVAYIAVQSFVTQRLLSGFGVKNTFLILPISGLLGTVCMMVAPGLGGGVAGFALQKLPQYTIDETARKSLQGLVPEERRGRVSLFMDSYLVSGGIILGAMLTGIVVLVGNWLHHPAYFYVYLVLALLASLVALWSVMQMRRTYDSSLLNWRLKRRQRGKSVLDKLEF